VNENKQNKNMNQNQQQQNNQQRPKDLESQGEQKGAQQIPSSQRDVTRE
jgi:hypothetical protein